MLHASFKGLFKMQVKCPRACVGCRLPEHVSSSGGKMMRTQAQLRDTLGRVPTTEELAQALGWSVQKVGQVSLRPLHLLPHNVLIEQLKCATS